VDVFPSKVNKMWFIAPKAATYFGQCAELCGIAHANMRVRVVAEPPEAFDRWVKEQAAPPPPATGAAARGQTLFATKGCVLCHTNTGPDAEGVQAGRTRSFEKGQNAFPAPNLTYFATRSVFAGAIVDLNEESLRDWLRDPESVKPGNRMSQLAPVYNQPGQQLTDQDIDALVAYLMSRKPPAQGP
jgi:cytochrome c oxidase subunit 2